MRICGENGDIELNSSHKTYQDINSHFRPSDRLKSYELLILKYQKIVSGEYGDDDILDSLYEIRMALNLSADGFLPLVIQRELSIKTNLFIDEALDKKYEIKSFNISPPKVGRKRNHAEWAVIISSVYKKIKTGLNQSESYKLVGQEFNKSPDTVRREFERFNSGKTKRSKNDQQ